MAQIDRIVNVQISLRTAPITSMSFSELLLVGNFTPLAGERVVIITDADELVDNYGVSTGSPLYRAAQVGFSQIPTIPQIYVGNKSATGLPLKTVEVGSLYPYYLEVGPGAPDPAYPDVVLTVTGTGFTVDTQIRFGTNMERTDYISPTQVSTIIQNWRFTGPDPAVPVSVVNPGEPESNVVNFQFVPVGAGDPGVAPPLPPPAVDDPSTIMLAIAGENTDWYAFCDTDHNEADTIDYAQWAEANNKLFVTVLSTPENTTPPQTDTGSVAAQLKNGNYFRTAWWYHPDPKEFTDVAITCRSFTKYPGGETWANQRLNAATVTPLSQTIARNIFGKNGNTFEPFRNINITQNGKVSGGEWIDVIRFRDWLCEEIRIRVFSQMIDNRIPYTDPGIAIIRSRIAQALDFGVFRGGIAPPEVNNEGKIIPSYTIMMPLSANVSFNNKANRILQDVYFTARLAGAIHVVEIKGTLTYEDLGVVA